jgi:hypothetical protein
MMDTPDLIESLAADARPVRAIRSPLVRTGGWLALAAGILLLLVIEHGLRPDLVEQLRKPSFLAGCMASVATGVLAAVGCLLGSLPDRSRRWLLLPLPMLLLWVSTIGYGCLTDWVSMDAGALRMVEAVRCFATVLAVSVPLSVAMFAMLRHAARLRPKLVTMTAGLAVAAMTSTALSLLHQIDATVMILAWNLGVAALLVALEGALGRRVLSRLARSSAPG